MIYMPVKTNSEIMRTVLETLVEKISRRTSKTFSVAILDSVLSQIRTQYPFLTYTQVQDTIYAEGVNPVQVLPEIDRVSEHDFYQCLNDIIHTTIQHLEHNADYFFIKEFREALRDIAEINFLEQGINLNMMQYQYIVERREALKIKNAEITENTIQAILQLLDGIYPEKQAILIMIEALQTTQKKFDFISAIELSDTADEEGYYQLHVRSELNDVRFILVGRALQQLIEDVRRLITWKKDISFISALKQELGEENLAQLKDVGVNLNQIETMLIRLEFQTLLQKSLVTIHQLLAQENGEQKAYESLVNIIQTMKQTHVVLDYVDLKPITGFNTSRDIVVLQDINQVEPYQLGKALRELIKYTCSTYMHGSPHFIEDFKTQLGSRYLSEIENIGVNLHFLELKFAR